MNISEYLALHRFAIEKQFEIVLEYQKRLKDATQAAELAKAEAQDRTVEYIEADADPDEIHTDRDRWVRFEFMNRANLASGAYQQKLIEIEQNLSGINQVCGLILQSAKQGVSAVHQASGWSMGRIVGTTETLGNVIRQARNQASHYEEGRPSQRVQDCFANLHADFNIPNDLTKNLARFVVFDVLGWQTYSQYESDMVANF
ncbi:hypothetical protein J41TS12_37020 [Paenibacillus antibioticophila]|uniref:Uncharacterized protein n=1 Tax=Paenibacillus antibioticophila TaxID=1274374 RepID=A0A919XT88_9BACL|nr:hypothetical protein [Paenibacillus antibioticophila]GIO38841.1 hypothetical protein J41TS12_37020 [Paenibacillus antibioticophila]